MALPEKQNASRMLALPSSGITLPTFYYIPELTARQANSAAVGYSPGDNETLRSNAVLASSKGGHEVDAGRGRWE